MSRTGQAPLVLHVVASGGVYGVERMLLGLLPALRAGGCDAALASLGAAGTAGGMLGDMLTAENVPVRYPVTGRFDPRGVVRIEAALRACHPGLVHLHGYKAVILAGSISLLKGIPTGATLHTEVRRTSGFGVQIKLEEYVLRRMDGTIAVSEAIRQELEERGVPPHRIAVIPNGIGDPLVAADVTGGLSRVDPDGPLLVYAGRLVEGKNVHLLIDAVHQLRNRFPRLRLHIAGEGPLREGLEARAGALGLGTSVRFLGFVEDMHPLLAGATCFVLPSRAEGMPISILEAMAMSVPIVATAVGSIPSMVSHGEEAVIVAPDDLAALIGGLEPMLDDPALRARMGRNARRRFLREFTADRTAARYQEFYAAVRAAREGVA